MNNLLKFFLPKTTFEILKFYVMALLAVAAIHFLPIASDSKVGLVAFVLLFLFPLICYFNHTMYLPLSLDWILLTPLKKTHIILSHGLVNLYKIIVTYGLSFIFLSFYEPKFVKKSISLFLDPDSSQLDTRLPVLEYINWMILIGAIVILIFGILPNYVQSLQQRQNYQVKKSTEENIKSYLKLLGVLMVLFLLLRDTPESQSYIPWLFKTTFLFTFILFGAIFSTLTSLRLYFSKNKIFYASGAGMIFMMFFFYFYALEDVKSKDLPLKDKIESYLFMGAYSGKLDELIVNELISSDQNLERLTFGTLDKFFHGKNKAHYEPVLIRWEQLCNERKDFTCRLVFLMHLLKDSKKKSFEILLSGCPRDLKSCLVVYSSRSASQDDKKTARNLLEANCAAPKNSFEEKICKKFISMEQK
jgi:hypothetical protein